MQLKRKLAIVSIVFVVVSAVLTFVLAITSEFKFNAVTYTGDETHMEQLEDDLSLESAYFLLSPKLYINYKINQLEYISDAEIERVLPNEVFITYTVNSPLFCDANKIYFKSQILDINDENAEACSGLPIINYSSIDEYELFGDSYNNLDESVREDVVEIEKITNYYRFTMTEDLVIDVYLDDIELLNNYDEYKVVESYIDLRPKYS